MSFLSLSKARDKMLRIAAGAENVAQFVLLRDTKPSLQLARPQNRRLSSTPRSRRHHHHHSRSNVAPFVQFAFRPSLHLDTHSLFNSSPSRALSTLLTRSLAQPPPLKTRSATTQAGPTTATPRTAPTISYKLSASPKTPDSSPAPSPASSPAFKDTNQSLTSGLSDEPIVLDEGERQVDWAHSFHGLSKEPFSKDVAETLMKPLLAEDVEVKPDGIIYLPEIKYRRILNQAFGPGGWGLAPRGETIVTQKAVTREYALLAHGRLVSIARGEQDYFSADGIPTATEGCKSNALMRCCKDLGIASELWDPRFVRKFQAQHAKEVWAEHAVTKKKKKVWIRKDDEVRYPYKQT
ncbi:MAG: hypothetical protein M1814_006183 [Vezdaea aestivalis]|nr:MAG: hypothetical protein M1814_006183 [Vezdaea aestivalis]